MRLSARLGLLLVSALLTIGAFPPFPGRFGALIAWIPFLISIRDASSRLAFWLGIGHGMMVFGGTLIWLVKIFGPMAFLLHLILALFGGAFAMVAVNLPDTLRRPWLVGPATAILWAGIEYFRCEWFTLRFPWITPGTALPPNLLTPLVGVYGISLLVILGSSWMTAARLKAKLAGLATILFVTASIVFTGKSAGSLSDPIRVAAVQGETLTFDQYLELSRSAEKPTDAIVWPEYALQNDIRHHAGQLDAVRALMQEKETALCVVGSQMKLEGDAWANTAFIIGRESILGNHQKNRPVHFFNDGEPGTKADSWPTPIGRVATPICFDNDYATVPRRAVAHGAELMLVPSMDAAHWTARQHLQHGELFRHRAAENGRWVVVAASSGLTQIIDPKGHRVATLPLFEAGVLNGEVEAISKLTPYTRFGWLLGPITSVLAAVLAIACAARRRANASPEEHDHARI